MAVPGKPFLRKVCGLTRAADALHAARSGANAVGMVFYARSPRAVDVAAARKIADAVPAGVLRVGVFVNERPGIIADTVKHARLDTIQLHGDETPSDCLRVRRASGDVTLWKAFRVGPRFEAATLRGFDADAFLLDTSHGGSYGGTGKSFAWQLAIPAKAYGPLILAGGLDGSNAAAAVRAVAPWGVDASSRLEARPGVKDRQRVERYLAALS